MERIFVKILACCMIAILLCCNLQLPVYANGPTFFSSSTLAEEGTTQTQEEREQSTTEEAGQKPEEVSSETTQEVTTTEVIQSTEMTEEVTAEEVTEDIEVITLDESEETTMQEDTIFEEMLEQPLTVGKSAAPNHTITMPNLTSEYFWLQKGSNPVRSVDTSRVIVLKNEKAVSQYMTQTYKNGANYNFTPRLTKNTKVTVGGGAGGIVPLSTIEAGDEKEYEDLYRLRGHIQSHVFKLNTCTSNPYAIYSNVGTWYDKGENKTYQVDMKLTIKKYTYPSKAIRDAMQVEYYDAAYAGFNTQAIGVTAIGADTVETEIEFFYHGTSTPIKNLKGLIQFIDIDAQQGVDLGHGFKDLILFNTSGTYLRYNALGTRDDSIGYACSGTATPFNYRDENTTVIGIFEGSVVNCVWTIARCDPEDTGGNAVFHEPNGFGVPQSGTATCYAKVRATGFLGIDNDIAFITLPPQVSKNVYAGSITVENSGTANQAISLENRDKSFTFVVSAASETPSDVEKAYYTKYKILDTLEAVLEVAQVKVYAGVSHGLTSAKDTYEDVSSYFNITVKEQGNHETKVEVTAKDDALRTAKFYGNSYYVHIQAKIKSDKKLKEQGLNLEDWYQKDNAIANKVPNSGNYQGTFAVENKARLSVASSMDTETDLTSNEVAVKIPMGIALKKTDKASGVPVEGVVFGLFGGKASEYMASTKPLLTAKTDQDGKLIFEAETFFIKTYGDGPYYIKEISVPEKYQNVWDKEQMEDWYLEIPTLKNTELLQGTTYVISEEVVNLNQELNEKAVKVKKKNTETEAILSGAVYKLYQWSEKKNDYVEYMTLTEGEEKGEAYYYNEKPITNTMDNLGSYKIVESTAPKGCILTGEEWTFTIKSTSKKDGSDLVYTSSKTKESQTGVLVYENPLQKGRIELEKTDEEGNPLEGVIFTITAAENIYAPWNLNSEGKPEKNAKPLVVKGTEIEKMTTDSEGKVTSTPLYIGRYAVVEHTGAQGYVKGDTIYDVFLEYGKDDSVAEIFHPLNVSNALMKPAVNIAKLANKTTEVQGVKPVLDEKGRYVNERVPGSYGNEEIVDYTITVTNVGNVPIHEVKVTDSVEQKNEEGKALADCVEKIGYEIPKDGIFTSKNKKQVRGVISKENPLEMTLDELGAGDQVEIHLTGKVRADIGNEKQLKNHVAVEAVYYSKESDDGNSELKEVEEGMKEDEDYINIPGTPKAVVAKKADKTTGVILKKGGRYEGNKIEGVYQKGENVDFAITVSNTGTAILYNIEVNDIFSDDLIKVIDLASVACKTGTYESTEGNPVEVTEQGVKEEGQYQLILDQLSAGDSVELHLTAVIKTTEDVPESGLENKVSITAEYENGYGEKEEIPVTKEMKDNDTIGVKVDKVPEKVTEEKTPSTKTPESKQEKSVTTKSSPKTGDRTPMLLYLCIIFFAASVGFYLYNRRKN